MRLEPERAHALAARALGLPGARALLRRLTRPSERLRTAAFGQQLASPLGVAAGLDKDGRLAGALGDLGFGFVEVGTVTPAPQPGNERPRVFRLPGERALINRMGFPSTGAEAVRAALGRGRRGPIAVNVGKNLDTPLERAAADFASCAAALAPVASFVVVNVSSPNTPGLRALQEIERLREVLVAVREAAGEAPLLVKIAPDLSDEDVDAIADLALELGLAGIVAVNTTVRRDMLAPGVYEEGGLSGPPLAARSLEVLRRLRGRVGDRLALISVGGVQCADDVWERLRAGATLVQVYTGLVYGGPLFARSINRGLEARLDAEGLDSLAALSVATDTPEG